VLGDVGTERAVVPHSDAATVLRSASKLAEYAPHLSL
jgi:hypothetical protein